MLLPLLLFLSLLHPTTALKCYEYDDGGSPYPLSKDQWKIVDCSYEECLHENHLGQNIRRCAKDKKECPGTCLEEVCCCNKDKCNGGEQPKPTLKCYVGTAPFGIDPAAIDMPAKVCHGWCRRTHDAHVEYDCTTEYRCRKFQNKCDTITDKEVQIEKCCCKDDLCNRKFAGDMSSEEMKELGILGEETTTSTFISTTSSTTTTTPEKVTEKAKEETPTVETGGPPREETTTTGSEEPEVKVEERKPNGGEETFTLVGIFFLAGFIGN